MSVVSATLMLVAAVLPTAGATHYDCAFDKMIVLYHGAGGWAVTDQPKANNSHTFQKVSLDFAPDGTVQVGAPPASLNLSGSYATTLLGPGRYVWSADEPASCGVLDAVCRPTADFHAGTGNSAKAYLAIYTGTEASEGAGKSLATVQFLYSCERQP